MLRTPAFVLQPDWFNPGLLESIGEGQRVVAEKRSTGLFLRKKYHAELIRPGALLGGRFDREVLSLYAIGDAEIIDPTTTQFKRQSIEQRKADIDQMLVFYQERDRQKRAIAMLTYLHQAYGFDKVRAIPPELLALWIGTNTAVIQLTWTHIFKSPKVMTSLSSLQSASPVLPSQSVAPIETIDVSLQVVDVPSQPIRKNRWIATSILMAAVGIGIGALLHSQGEITSATGPEPSALKTERIIPVSAYRLSRAPGYDVKHTYIGEVQATRTSDIGFEIAGTLLELPFREGDRVNAGDVLARLDTQSIQAQRQQLLAKKVQAQAQLKELKNGPRQEEIETMRATVQELEQEVMLAQSRSQRGKQLYHQGAISQESYEERFFHEQVLRKRQQQSQNRLNQLEAGTRVEKIDSQNAQILEINARMKTLAVEQAKATLKAPFSGYVAKKQVSEGAALNSGQSILQLVESGVMEARIGMPQSAAHRLKPGQAWPIKIENTTYSATVRTVLPDVDPKSRTVTVAFRFRPQSFIPLGQSVTLSLKTQDPNPGFWLPTTALIAGEKGLWSTYLLTPYILVPSSATKPSPPTFTVVRREVEVLHTESDRVYVRGELQSGDHIIDQGGHRLTTGQRVRITKKS